MSSLQSSVLAGGQTPLSVKLRLDALGRGAVVILAAELRLSTAILAFLGLGLIGVWIMLTLFSAALFERESILTRWR